eukprot:1355119-Pleurochrysis_carterae.AAC.3
MRSSSAEEKHSRTYAEVIMNPGSQLPAHARDWNLAYMLSRLRFYLNRGDTELLSEASNRHKVCSA